MSASPHRELVAQVVIILGVCVGGWMVFVQPREKELSQLRAKIGEASAASLVPAVNQDTIEQSAVKVADAKSRLRDIQGRNDLAGDSSRLYGLIMELAESHDVQVRELTPGAEQNKSAKDAVAVTRVEMILDGSYERISDFLDAMDRTEAFLRPVSLSLTPVQDQGVNRVAARFICEVLRFKLPDALTATGETTTHAQQ